MKGKLVNLYGFYSLIVVVNRFKNGVGSQFAEEKRILIFFVGANPSLEGESQLSFLFVNEYAISSASSTGNRLRFFGHGFLFM